MTTATLLVELVTEELPPKALKRLGEAFAHRILAELRQRGFLDGESATKAYATPRRLAVSITRVRPVAPDTNVEDKLMPVRVARDAAGHVTEALKKKLAGLGRAHLATDSLDAADGPDAIYVASDGKADYVYLRSLAKGPPLSRGLQDALDAAIANLPIPKVMSYAAPGSYYNNEKFVRPAHRLVALHGADGVPVTALGLAAGRTTEGHRFVGRREIEVSTAEAYADELWAEGKVVASFALRRAAIEKALAAQLGGTTLIAPDALLDEVTALVEWPVVYAGSFDPAFLAVPQECLILTMQQNQKYFPLADAKGKLAHRFLLVSNVETRDPAAIIAGNERVLRARLADAKFFYDQDRRQPLAARVEKLRSVVYHGKLGSQADRIERVRVLASRIAAKIGADPAAADRAALLAKADLVTDMVGEFPELQGVMGRYYALHDGEQAVVADAIAQHYWPRFAGDALPEGKVAQAVALADKLETLAGLFGIDQIPTGDKDPFGLRRAALGVIRILVERQLVTAAAGASRARLRRVQERARGKGRAGFARELHLRPPARLPARGRLHGEPDRRRRRRQPRPTFISCPRGSPRCNRSRRCRNPARSPPRTSASSTSCASPSSEAADGGRPKPPRRTAPSTTSGSPSRNSSRPSPPIADAATSLRPCGR